MKKNPQTFPNSAVEIIDTTRLFSVKTLQYLLFTAIGFTCKKKKKNQNGQIMAILEGNLKKNERLCEPSIELHIKNQLNILCTSTLEYPRIAQWFQRLEHGNDGNPVTISFVSWLIYYNLKNASITDWYVNLNKINYHLTK